MEVNLFTKVIVDEAYDSFNKNKQYSFIKIMNLEITNKMIKSCGKEREREREVTT